MNYETKLEKGRDGWRAETYIELPDVKSHAHARDGKPGVSRLSISTSKDRRGGLQSWAGVAFHGADGFTVHAMGMGTGSGDYGKTVSKSAFRCTEKAVKELHAHTLELVPTILDEVRAHYAAQQAKAGPRA